MPTDRAHQLIDLAGALRAAHPELGPIAAAPEAARVYLVGGAVRDLLLGRERADVDLVVVGDPAGLATALGAETLAAHERFGTAKVALDGHEVDLAAARTETYAHPGALPTVAAADSIEADLSRRDFTINAMAIPLAEPDRLIDPHAGRADLEAGLIRILHPGSFIDDPTRALRAARYASRFGFTPEPATGALLAEADLAAVSADRREAELRRLATEPNAAEGFALLQRWGLVDLRPGGIELAAGVCELLREERWRGEVERADAVLAAALGPVGREAELAATTPSRPSDAVALARRSGSVELLLARALGARWIDQYLDSWRRVSLAIDGDDLIAAGVPRGPALGRGLAAALAAKQDGEISSRDQELARALAAAAEEAR
ncbi:MAG: CCA tRNA nucleotidyltransferase [Syntrophothermus sp.]